MGNSFDFDVAARVQNAARVGVTFDVGFGFRITMGNVNPNHTAAGSLGVSVGALVDHRAIPIIVV